LVKRLRQWPQWYSHSSLPPRANAANRDGEQGRSEHEALKVRRSQADERPAPTVARSWIAVLERYE
jgi:hypothetical protein